MLSLSASLFVVLSALFSSVFAENLLQTTSLNTCQDNSQFTASLLNVVFTPSNGSVAFAFVGVSNIQGYVIFDVRVNVYGYPLIHQTLDPCKMKDLAGLCPMSAGPVDNKGNIPVDKSSMDQLPGVAYGIPDVDATVIVYINSTSNPKVGLACLEAQVSNGQTVNQKGVAWATAVVAGLALVVSAVISGLGHSNTAAHIASYALALFGYFQATAIIGLIAVPLPPMVAAWTQNFDWTLGIIKVDFMQRIATWYQKSTGGTPATVLNTLTTLSVQIQKRSFYSTIPLLEASHFTAVKRANNADSNLAGTYIVTGITRVAFKNNMESTNLFLTGLAFFCIFIVFTVILVTAFKWLCEAAIKAKWMTSNKFQDFRNGWLVVLKGIMFRMVLIGYPQMTILCLWELTQIDSPAEVVLAIFFISGMSTALGWAAWKVVSIAKRSMSLHQNPAYMLYSDPTSLNKWGFLYIQFRATAYYYVLPVLVYCVAKGMFVAFGQNNGAAQAIGLLLIEAIALIGASVMKPWMDKKTNIVNIAICAINFLNAIFLMFFCDIFNQPPLATGIMGVLFFLFNAVFALVLLIMVVTITMMSLVRKNPDARYQPMTDDRASFIKSQSQLTTELDALGITARGDKGYLKSGLNVDDEDDSLSLRRREIAYAGHRSLAASPHEKYQELQRSPINSSIPIFPSDSRRNDSPGFPDVAYRGYADKSANVSPEPFSPTPAMLESHYSDEQFRMQNTDPVLRQQNNAR